MNYGANTKIQSFIKYCLEHPEERFWQALRNWSKYDFIMGWNGEKCNGVFDHGKAHALGFEDTFYIEDESGESRKEGQDG